MASSDVTPGTQPGDQPQLADLPLREELRGQHAYGAPQLTVANQLNTNENPYAPAEVIMTELADKVRHLDPSLNRYPDRDATQLRADLAAYVSRQTGVEVGPGQVWAANGSNEVLQQLLQAFGGPGRRAMGFTPSYSMHPILCAGTQTEFLSVARREEENFRLDVAAALAEMERARPDIVFVTTPNNPTGNVTPLDDLRQIIQAAAGIVIVDEAYAEFTDFPSACTLLAEFPTKLVVSRTMSKAFDFAGGRLGYFVASQAFVEAVMLVRLPYHLSSLTQTAARVALRHSAETLKTVDILRGERDRVLSELRRLGYRTIQSHANFIFFGRFQDSPAVWQEFLDRQVLIRDVGVPGWLRASVGLPAENDHFIRAAGELRRTVLTEQ
ncbi:histidinol-phosphate transaminase [Corynebacterium heidelbergense]|uniref:Histidinol-phosphate aminotransferase n=1 Tax=Corynebacterium heidelbergense TaxID=2055947 RepID=A0A364VB70_9CORY|nr:histidinol-phosphate transaminase [Corynebacterium heidelbergense]RAV33864.1 histidinol-phosphate transaminase [Corynebacterium heidelbergense]WCZ36408.1 Histidinol-phosphate aminotransferase [Corynebacterium heidelbergense]